MSEKAQDWGTSGSPDARGFGTQVPNPGGFDDKSTVDAFFAGNSYELAEAEAARGDFERADELLAKGDGHAYALTGSWFGRAQGWRAIAYAFVAKLRPQEAQLREETATDDRAYMASQELDPDDQKTFDDENKLTAALMLKKEAGASDSELQAEYNGIPAILAPFASADALKDAVDKGVSSVAGALGKPAAIVGAIALLLGLLYVARRFA